MEYRIGKTTIELYQGDIAELDTEAIVNAANSSLIMGGGVAGAIRRKGGPSIQKECNRIGGTSVGEAVVTGAGNLKAKYIIHTVGPRYEEGNEDEKLKNATLNALKRAQEKKIRSIALPAISTGIFGFPLDRAAKIMVKAVKEFLTIPSSLKLIVFALFDKEAYDTFAKELKKQLE
ncbi:macro domain-containing protein [bacterium]|nr:macro domain-containing protein [bacterium]